MTDRKRLKPMGICVAIAVVLAAIANSIDHTTDLSFALNLGAIGFMLAAVIIVWSDVAATFKK